MRASSPVYDDEMEAVGLKGIRFSFRLQGEFTKRLNGHFKVEHDDCENKFCGETTDFQGGSFDEPIKIETNLDPCTNHTGIKIKASEFELDGGGVMFWKRDWYATNCNMLNDTQKTETRERKGTNLFTENSFKNSIILSIALFVIISMAVIISMFAVCKKRSKEKRTSSQASKLR